jgi:hypothetical protein
MKVSKLLPYSSQPNNQLGFEDSHNSELWQL